MSTSVGAFASLWAGLLLLKITMYNGASNVNLPRNAALIQYGKNLNFDLL